MNAGFSADSGEFLGQALRLVLRSDGLNRYFLTPGPKREPNLYGTDSRPINPVRLARRDLAPRTGALGLFLSQPPIGSQPALCGAALGLDRAALGGQRHDRHILINARAASL